MVARTSPRHCGLYPLWSISREDLSEAEHFVKLLYAEVLYLYEKRIEAEGKTVRPESMLLP